MFLTIFCLICLIPIILGISTFIPIEERNYELPSVLASAQQQFRYGQDNGIYIPSIKKEKINRLSNYWYLCYKYGKFLQEFEVITTLNEKSEDASRKVEIDDFNDGFLYVALPAYIAGNQEAGIPKSYGYQFEIRGFDPDYTKEADLLSTRVMSIDEHVPNLKNMSEAVNEDLTHNIKVVTMKGEHLSFSDSLYGAIVRAHYTLDDIWGLNDMMYFDLPGFTGSSGGAATAYEVMLNAKETVNNHGHFVVTGTIDPEGLVGSIGGINAKTHLSIKQSIPVMFVPKENYNDAIRIKELMHSNITIVPIEKLKDISAFWDKAGD